MRLFRWFKVTTILYIFTSAIFLFIPMKIFAVGLDDLVNDLNAKSRQSQESSLKAAQEQNSKRKLEQDAILGIGIEPYSNDEILLILVLNSFADYTNYDKGVYPWTSVKDIKKKEIVLKSLGIDSVNEQKLMAFNNKYFGLNKCKNAFQPFIYPFDERIDRPDRRWGLWVTSAAVEYLIQKNSTKKDEMNDPVRTMKNIFEEINSSFSNKYIVGFDCNQQRFDNNSKNLKEMVNFILKNENLIIEKRKKADADYSIYLEEMNSINKAEAAAIDAARAKKLACFQSDKYIVYEISKNIDSQNRGILYNENIIKNEKKAAAISGYVNKQIIYDSGKLISIMSDGAARMFIKYKKAGGTADSFKSVTIPENPCPAP